MSDVKRYNQKRAERDPEFAENYEVGYADFEKRKSEAPKRDIGQKILEGIRDIKACKAGERQ